MIPSLRETASAQALQHRFCHHPQCAIELNVGINAVNGPGMDTFSFCTATGNPAFPAVISVRWRPGSENIRKYRLSRVIAVESMRQQHVKVHLRPDRWPIDGTC